MSQLYTVEYIGGTSEDLRAALEETLNSHTASDPVEYIPSPMGDGLLVVFKRKRKPRGENN